MPCNLPFSDSTGCQDLKLQYLHFSVRIDIQDLALYGWCIPNSYKEKIGDAELSFIK